MLPMVDSVDHVKQDIIKNTEVMEQRGIMCTRAWKPLEGIMVLEEHRESGMLMRREDTKTSVAGSEAAYEEA